MSVITSLHEQHKERVSRIKRAALKDLTAKPVEPKIGSITDIILTEVCAYYKVRKEDILAQRRGAINHPRHMVVYLLYLTTSYTNPQIASKIQRDPATITYSLQKTKREAKRYQTEIDALYGRIMFLIGKKKEREANHAAEEKKTVRPA
jgi:chromosomal replication initiation ATPase DnaA